jgi:two-component sensor histidine kinase
MNALARTHDVLIGDRVEGADLERLIRGVVSPLCGDVEETFDISGPPVELPPRVAMAMTMVMHELCTNALKHGALNSSGHIDVKWGVGDATAGRRLDLTWREQGVTPIPSAPQQSKGFGARLIAVAFGEFGTSKLIFERDAVICVIAIALPESAVGA